MTVARKYHRCPVCGVRLNLRSPDLEDDPYLLEDPGVFHHACLVALKTEMAARGLPDTARGARLALHLLRVG